MCIFPFRPGIYACMKSYAFRTVMAREFSSDALSSRKRFSIRFPLKYSLSVGLFPRSRRRVVWNASSENPLQRVPDSAPRQQRPYRRSIVYYLSWCCVVTLSVFLSFPPLVFISTGFAAAQRHTRFDTILTPVSEPTGSVGTFSRGTEKFSFFTTPRNGRPPPPNSDPSLLSYSLCSSTYVVQSNSRVPQIRLIWFGAMTRYRTDETRDVFNRNKRYSNGRGETGRRSGARRRIKTVRTGV